MVTRGHRLKANHVYHAITRAWEGTEADSIFMNMLYTDCLILAQANGCHSIGFPLLMAGYNGCPPEVAWRIALQSCREYLSSHGGYPMDITFCTLDEKLRAQGDRILLDIQPVTTD